MSLLSGYQFDPQAYQGLLGQLQQLMQQPQQAQQAFNTPHSLPSEPAFDMNYYRQGETQVPIFGQPQAQPHDAVTAQSRMPQQAMQPQMQAPQPQQPAALPETSRMDAMRGGFMANAHTGPIGALLGGAMGAATGTYSGDLNNNTTVKALVARNVPVDLAKAAVKSPQIMAAVLQQAMGTKNGVIINGRLVNPATGALIADYSDTSTKAPETKEFETPDGRKVVKQWNASAKRWDVLPIEAPQAAQPQMGAAPGGIAPAPAGLSKEGRVAWETGAAKDALERITNAPQARNRAKDTIQTMFKTGQEALRLSDHSGLASAVGPIQGRLPTLRDDPANFEADVGTLGTKLFINTINSMRELSKTGGAVGSVTEKEMTKLENAQRSLSLTQADGNMRGNLQKLVGDINDSMAAVAAAYKQQYGEDLPFQKIEVPDTAKGGAQVARPKSVAEAAKLPKGTPFIDPNGIERVR
jgi:hypothetical protein